MDYPLENLDPERFQEFCHALLAAQNPNVQCLPVGQRDGGRDALSYEWHDNSGEFIIYQVKFVRKPLALADPHKWLIDTIANEAPAVKARISDGAKRYFLLTNVPGTAYPGSGSIDTVHKLLTDQLSLPAQCWWRDDINRRLDSAWDLKWSYPELLTGRDVVRAIIEGRLTEHGARRASAIRAFVRDQYDRDTEVRFKQVELQNKLLDLFIDVPVEPHPLQFQKQARRAARIALQSLAQHAEASPDSPSGQSIGAATLLLNPAVQATLNRVVIEGAPGQGKSTIAQYVCQSHRLRLLEGTTSNHPIPDHHLKTQLRLPFKVDCRDLSQWLNRRNPFSADDSAVPSDWHKTLESFLAAQVAHHSGGSAFDVSDLHAVARLSALVLVFDGLDEVADISSRREVVDSICKGLNRLESNSLSIQAIVTSRPAAFANSPGMPDDSFCYFHLASINQPLIDAYAEKWLTARRLDGKEAADVRRILNHKLDQPHLRELARNPMQLAILLSLIQTRGGSLPDKRTALYDNYVDLFFNREAEKSSIVRDYRDLLVDIHRYLAWVLHSEAQTRHDRGSTSADRLRQLVEQYLTQEGHDPSLAAILFTGMVERVVALVSRVEGTYEFEVQPLREYFAARHLYNTAPYSPTGAEKRGTLPDRFDALARDFFWQNVARFYAGCFSKGELPSLVDRLEELARSPGYKDTAHPHTLAATLLGDWVFAQHPKSLRQVVSLVLSDLGLRCVAAGGRYYRGSDVLVLPKQSGREELIDRCFELLAAAPPADYSGILLELINANASYQEARDHWLRRARATDGTVSGMWVSYGSRLGVLSKMSPPELDELLADATQRAQSLRWFLTAGHSQFIEADGDRFRTVADLMLDAPYHLALGRNSSILEKFCHAIDPFLYSHAFPGRAPVPLNDLWHRRSAPRGPLGTPDAGVEAPRFAYSRDCYEIVALAQSLSGRSAEEWATRLDPWDKLVEACRARFGDRWALFRLANTAAAIRSKQELCEEATALHDSAMPLCRRVRYARLRAGSPGWWETQCRKAESQSDIAFTLLVLLTWAGPSVFEKHGALIDDKVSQLDDSPWHLLNDTLASTEGASNVKPDRYIRANILPKTLCARSVVAISARLREDEAEAFCERHLADYSGDDATVLEFCQRTALRSAIRDPRSWQKWLPIIARSYRKGAAVGRYFGYRLATAVRTQNIPDQVAAQIVRHCRDYPTELVAWAEQNRRQRVAEGVTPVGTRATQEAWF